MNSPNESKKTYSRVTKAIIAQCESTGKFKFNSSRFASVGEFGLAFHGIFRFVEGNARFKAELGRDYEWLKSKNDCGTDFGKLPIFYWTD